MCAEKWDELLADEAALFWRELLSFDTCDDGMCTECGSVCSDENVCDYCGESLDEY